MTSRPALFFGKAMKSLMESAPPKSEQKRSNPKAMPPWGGAPYLKAFIRNPNCFSASSCEKPSVSNSRLCSPLSKIRIEPPPTSVPFTTKS